MGAKLQIGVLVGSLREESFTRKVAKEVASMLSDRFDMVFFELDDLVMYNQDLDDKEIPPEAWLRFRKQVREADGYLFATPEYNRSMPGVIKNALDIGSRPYGQNAWGQKPGAVLSVSPGKIGAFGANHHLRQCLTFLNVYTLQQPEAYLGEVMNLLDESGKIQDESARAFLKTFADALGNWVERFAQ